MRTERTKSFDALHIESGIIVEVFKVDCFIEQCICDYPPSFVFTSRFYETQNKQKIILKSDSVCIVQTEVGNLHLKRI